jgi:hypothetical protein
MRRPELHAQGGTSFSKGFRVVERFSEDIDVLVLLGELGSMLSGQ